MKLRETILEQSRICGIDPYKQPFKPADIDALPALRRSPPHKECINRRNWRAISGVGPKHRPRRVFPGVQTSDWILRFRPNCGLIATIGSNEVDLHEMAAEWTECVIPERLMLKFAGFKGSLPRAIITCENLGAYIDLPHIPASTIVFSPGKDIRAVILFLRSFPDAKWLHVGD